MPLFFARSEMTLPSTVRDKLIFFSSVTCYLARTSSRTIFSEPAKSHRLNFDRKTMPFSSGWTVCITI